MDDLISRQAAKLAIVEKGQASKRYKVGEFWELNRNEIWDALDGVPSAQPEQRWIPVTIETLPNPNSVVVVCGKKGTWDCGTYRGWHGDIHSWWWKKNSIKHVYWWMYKDDAMSLPYREEGEQDG